MVASIARFAGRALVFALLVLLHGCSWRHLCFGELCGAFTTRAEAVAGKDGPALNQLFSFRGNVELRPCAQTTDALGFTEHCDFVFPDGTTIRSIFEYDTLTGNVVLNRYGPIILQLPLEAGYFAGSAANGLGAPGNLLVTSGLSTLPLDTTTTMRAEPGTQLVIVDLPAGPAVPGALDVKFNYRANSPTFKVMTTAKFQVGSRTFYPPVLPCVTNLGGLAPLSASSVPGTSAITAFAQPCKSKIYNFLGAGDPGPHPVTVVEFYNVALDHYFITWLPDEIAALDVGTSSRGWSRTGLTFNAFRQQGNGTSPVCRYYLPPQFGDSHFFGRGAEECRSTGDRNPSFVLEQSDYLHIRLPAQGLCPGGTRPIYRVFSNRSDANHRYTTDPATRDLMVQRGWLAEGDGPDLVVMCGPV